MSHKWEISNHGSQCLFLAFLIHARAAKWVWRKKSLLDSFSAADMENHLIFAGARHPIFCVDLQTLCVCLDSQVSEATRGLP